MLITQFQAYPMPLAERGVSPVAIAEFITMASLVASFFVFLLLTIRFRHSEGGILLSFKLQLAIATLVWIVGELFALTGYLADLSVYVHTLSMALFAFFLVYRGRALMGR